MKTRRFLTILAAVLMLCLVFTSCDLINGGKNPGAAHFCPECGKCLDADCTLETCVEKCEGHHFCTTCGLCADEECTEETCTEKCPGHEEPAHECEHACPECGKCIHYVCEEDACTEKCEGHVPPHECEHACSECGKCLDPDCADDACIDKCEGHVPPHACEHVCEECGKCLDSECAEDACTDKCEGHVPPHECEHACEICGGCKDADCAEEACANKCTSTHHTCEHACEICGGCKNAECEDAACANKCNTSHHECTAPCDFCGKCENDACTDPNCAEKCACTTPTLTVDPPVFEVYAEDEVDLMVGVIVTDEGDDEVRVIITDDQGFDPNSAVEGEYLITYLAINKFGKQATATRTVIVLPALSALTLEAQESRANGEGKWNSTLINFKNKLYFELNADYIAAAAESGVYHNNTNGDIVISIPGQYGVAAIITKNGVVIEGRDGANNRFVNVDNPLRENGATKLPGTDKVVGDVFAQNMVVPAGGYAIVVQSNYAGNSFDLDGRGYMVHNVIYRYGNVVRLLWADDQSVLTEYVDMAPSITGNTTTVIAGNGDFVLSTGVLEGVKAIDDKGTFDPSDDVEVEVTIVDDGGFNLEVSGVYTITLQATDGTNTTTVTRKVEVNRASVTLQIGSNKYTTLEDYLAIDKDVTLVGNTLFFVYTPNYKKGINYTNGYGEAFVLNKYGIIVRIYDGANGKYYDADNKSGIVDATKCSAANYLTQAYSSLQAGEYLLVAPNGAQGNIGRAFLLSNRTIGAEVIIPGITFAPHECNFPCGNCGKCTNTACTKPACEAKCDCHKCESICEICGLCTDFECTEYYCQSKCPTHAHQCESVCQYCSGCTDAACTESECANKCAGHTGHKFLIVNGKTLEIAEDKWLYNTSVNASNAPKYGMLVYDKNYNGSVSINGYGAAIVIDSATGEILRIYDGANGGLYTKDGKAASAGFTTSNFATIAWQNLQAGETLIICPNDGGSNATRGFLLALRPNVGGPGCGAIAQFFTAE